MSFEVKKGECLALLGPSGCGKSSTLRLIAGLDRADEGTIYIENKNLENISPVNRKIGMVFQSYALFPHLSVAANLSLGLKVRGIKENERIKMQLSLMTSHIVSCNCQPHATNQLKLCLQNNQML